MNYRALGSTGLKVSEIGFGAWAIGGDAWGKTDDRESIRALQKALDLGVNFFDTADVYGKGHSEFLIGKAFQNLPRDRYILASKVGNDFHSGGTTSKNFAKDYVLWAVDQSLERLKTDYLDIYQLHNPPDEIIDKGDVFDALEALVKLGKIRFFGISISSPQQGINTINRASIASIQVVYNLLNRGAEQELFPTAALAEVGIIARVPLASGLLTGKYSSAHPPKFGEGDHRSKWTLEELHEKLKAAEKFRTLIKPGQTMPQAAIRFVLARPEVSVVIPGMKTALQVMENVKATNQSLSPQDLNIIQTLT